MPARSARAWLGCGRPAVPHNERMPGRSPCRLLPRPAAAVVAIGWALIATGGLAGGCTSSGPSALRYSVQSIQSADRAAVLTSARAVLNALGYRIEREETGAGVLTTHAIHLPPREVRRSLASRLSSGPLRRRIVQVRIPPATGELNVYCRVSVEEQDTARGLFMDYGLASSDVPNETPIERDAATLGEHNVYWRTLRRDTAAERSILDAIARRMAGLPPVPDPSPSPAPPTGDR